MRRRSSDGGLVRHGLGETEPWLRTLSQVIFQAIPRSCNAKRAPLRLANFISEYFLERMTPSAPPRKAAITASLVPSEVHLLWPGSVGMSTSMPGHNWVLVPLSPARER